MENSLAHRLSAARKTKKLTQQGLAKLSGVAQSDISKIERGVTLNPTASSILALSQVLGIDPYSLTGDDRHQSFDSQNVTPIELRVKVPLIKWADLDAAQGVNTVLLSTGSGSAVDVFEADVSVLSFALKVINDSMVSPLPGDSVSFPVGTIIKVDPMVKAVDGDFVVARPAPGMPTTFKRMVHDSGRWYLKPLNPAYPTTEFAGPGLVVAKVVEFYISGKL